MSSSPGGEAATYQKLLLARFSPENGCRGPDNGRLIPASLGEGHRSARADSHFFVSTLARKANRFGWVSEVEPFTLTDLSEEDAASRPDGVDPLPDEWLKAYLDQVAKYPPGTPMACGLLRPVGAGLERVSLRVHKVFFYDADSSR